MVAASAIQKRIRIRKEEHLNMCAQLFKKDCGNYAMALVMYGRSVRRRMAADRARFFFRNYGKLDCAKVFHQFRRNVINAQQATRSYMACGMVRSANVRSHSVNRCSCRHG